LFELAVVAAGALAPPPHAQHIPVRGISKT
jgi:hypothetical protein